LLYQLIGLKINNIIQYMAENPNNLPYFKIKQETEVKIIANFLLRKFKKKIIKLWKLNFH